MRGDSKTSYAHIVKDIIEDMTSSETERGSTGVEVMPVVVSIGDGDGNVLSSIAVGVTNKRGFPVVVKNAARHGNLISSVGDVEKAIVVVLVMVLVGRQIDVVDPNLRGLLNADSISCLSKNLANFNVTDDDIGLLEHTKSNTLKSWIHSER
jgi:hypothetical protein